MLSGILRITLMIAVACYFIIILLLLKRKALELKYTLLWLFAGVVMGVILIFPEILLAVIHMLGIETYMNGLFALSIGFILSILMAVTSIVSRQLKKINRLIQENAILEKRIRELEHVVGMKEKGKGSANKQSMTG
jgi:hypothetical protein